MVKIFFEAPDGNRHVVDAVEGVSLMEAAVTGMVDGLDADCGGNCACATCMVYVSPEWVSRLTPPDKAEEAMLAFCPHLGENSRLACQIFVSEELDQLEVSLPPSQQ